MRLIVLLLALLIGGAAPAPEKRPNILFVLIDDLGFADFSVTGNRIVATPNIDRLAADGLLMTQFYVASPICSPSRAAFLIGRFPARVGFVSFIDGRAHNHAMAQANWLDPKLPMLPRTLREAGYATGHFGKWHLGGGRDIGDAPLPAAYGFDESYVQFEGLGPRVLMTEDHYGLSTKSAALGQGPVDRLPKALISARYVDKTLDFVRRKRAAPWFAQVWLDDVHDPYEPTPEQLAAVKGKGRDAKHRRFLAVLVATDREIGRLVAGLRAAGELDDTLIVLTGDNGPTAAAGYYRNGAQPPGETGGYRGRKASLYEGGVREPLIVRWPGHAPKGKRDGDTVVSAVDFLPTLAAIAGTRTADGDGIDMSAAWRGQATVRTRDLFWAYGQFGAPGASPAPAQPRDVSPPFAIRSGRWKLLAEAGGGRAELYDLVADPFESRDLTADRPDLVRRLSARLEVWRRSIPGDLRQRR